MAYSKNQLLLIRPSDEYINEIRAYRREFLDYNDHFHGESGLRNFENIADWITQCRLMEHKETIPVPEWVEAEQFMLVRGSEKRILGMINFRHYMNDYLTEYAGHIGYSIRPTERRKGYAKEMLALCLEECWDFGLDKVLITCDIDNEASRRTILANGGVFDRLTQLTDENNYLERYWITKI